MTGDVQTLRLEKTVFHRGKFIRELTIRPPTPADLEEAGASSDTALGRGVALVSILANLDPLAALKLSKSEADMERIQALVDGWLP